MQCLGFHSTVNHSTEPFCATITAPFDPPQLQQCRVYSNYYITLFLSLKNVSGTPRPPFDNLIQTVGSLQKGDNSGKRSPAIVSIDIPSGWHVEHGDAGSGGIKPDMLVCPLSYSPVTRYAYFCQVILHFDHRNCASSRFL